MALEFEKRTYRLTGITPMLGSQPADPEIRSKYLASKAPTPEAVEAETNMEEFALPEDKGITVFMRDKQDGNFIMMDYMIRGYLKSSLEAMGEVVGVAMAKSKIDRYVMVQPRIIPIMRGGEPIYGEDAICERPLRAETMKGPRTALASSEQIDDPWTIEFSVMVIPNKSTPKSKAVTAETIETILDYGEFSGLGQWRNGGWGRFTWERIS